MHDPEEEADDDDDHQCQDRYPCEQPACDCCFLLSHLASLPLACCPWRRKRSLAHRQSPLLPSAPCTLRSMHPAFVLIWPASPRMLVESVSIALATEIVWLIVAL